MKGGFQDVPMETVEIKSIRIKSAKK
jgi:hypothetical protein